MEKDTLEQDKTDEKPTSSPTALQKYTKPILIFAAVLLSIFALGYGYIFLVSPANIRSPQLEHAHLRFQYIIDGVSINFGDDAFQEDYVKGQCSALLPEKPIHFHDNQDQFVHLHWKDVTGGQLLKYYGNNLIGGKSDSLGYKIDSPFKIINTPIHGDLLPETDAANLWIYTGTAESYERRTSEDFLNQDFETFFGTESTVKPVETSGIWDLLSAKAYAHGEVDDGHSSPDDPNEADLQRVQNLLGNVIIFVQAAEPTDEEITEKLNNLIPLNDSTCGG